MQPLTRRLGAAAVAALGAFSLAAAAALPGATAAPAHHSSARQVYAARATAPQMVKMDLIALNDFHGNLDVVPSTSSSGRINNTPAGGVAYLASQIRGQRALSRANGAKPITVAAGDLIGASPLLSAAFHDEPTIEAMNKIGLQVSSVGNHEFDEGVTELQRMQNGGCLDDGSDVSDGQDSCPGDKTFAGANFTYLSANTFWKDPAAHSRPTVFPAVKVMTVKKQKVAFIGMTLEDTPTIVAPSGIQDVRFADEVETANALVPPLRARGIKSIVVLLHEGVTPTDSTAYNDCSGVTGNALTIAQNLSPAIDAVVSGHTHQPYNCTVLDPKGQPRLLTSAASFGRMTTTLHFLIDPRTHDIVRPAEYARNQIVQNGTGFTAAQDLQDLVDAYKTLVQPVADAIIGHIDPGTQILKTADSNGGDSPLGNLIADAQKADTSVVESGGPVPVIGLMNPGGIRADLLENDSGDVTYGAAFSVQPFNNSVVSMDLTGAQIKTILNQQWNGKNEATAAGNKILQVSGISYTWDKSEAALADTNAIVGDVLVDDDGDGATPMVPLVDGTTYRVAANNFIADGGDNFTGFTAATNRVFGGFDVDALVNYLKAHDPVAPTATDRISSVS